MKSARFARLAAILCVGFLVAACTRKPMPSGATRRDVVVAIPNSPSEWLRTSIVEGIVKSTAVNVGIHVIDGTTGANLATAVLVDDTLLANDSQLRRDIVATPLDEELATAVGDATSMTPLDLVGVADNVGRLPAGEQTQIAVVIFVPLQRSLESDAGVAIEDNRYPSLGFLNAPSSGEGSSTLSTKGREHRLQGLDVYLVSPQSETWEGPEGARWRHEVERFWVWWLRSQGAKTVRYIGTSLETAVQAAIDGTGTLPDEYAPPPSPTDEQGMLRVDLPNWLQDCNPETAVASGFFATRSTGRLLVGITWEGGANVDLDLHARGSATAPELYFENTLAPGALFEKKKAPSGETGAHGFEWVTFDSVDVRAVRLSVNLFQVMDGGSLPHGANGQLRVLFDGNCYVQPFHIEGTQGNRGAGRDDSRRSARPGWVDLDLARIVGRT